MFQDLDSTLMAILNDVAMPAALVNLRNASKSFVTPDRNFSPAQATVNLFLYEAKENRQLRDPDPIIERVGNSFVQRPPPLRVDCCYLITTWSPQVGAVGVAEGHMLLAQALLWLSRFPTIPSTYLQASLANQLYPPPTLVAQMDGQKNLGEFWFALGIPPRPAFHLTVTITMELLLQAEGSLVTTTLTETRQMDAESGELWIQIGGTVLEGAPPRSVSGASAEVIAINAAGTGVRVDDATRFRAGDLVAKGPVGRARITAILGNLLTLDQVLPGLTVGDILHTSRTVTAWVALEDVAGRQLHTTTTDALGRFIFVQLKPGNYTLRTRVTGFPEKVQPIEVPSLSGEYDVKF
jgi:Pvc16 N-terminal domain